MCDLFGGPSQGEQTAYQETSALSQSLLSNFRQQYAQQQSTLGQLEGEISRIQTGQTGPGFSGEENAALRSEIVNQGAAAARNAIQANRSVGSGATGTLTSGINAQVEGQIGAITGTDTANQLLKETTANYAQGRENAIRAASAFQTMYNSFNPTAYAGMAGQELGQQFTEADKINQEKIARSQAIAGLVEKVGLGAATFGAGGIAALGSGESFGEGLGDFFKGGMNASFGTNFGINSGSAPVDLSSLMSDVGQSVGGE